MVDIKSLIIGNESLILPKVKSVADIQELMKDIEYERFTDESKYIVKTPDQVLKEQKCVCYDAVELERVLFDKLRYEYRTYFIYEFDESGTSGTHTFLLYKEAGKCWWFEHSWYKHRGIHGPFSSYENSKQYVSNRFKMDKSVAIKEYKKFNFKGMDLNQFGQYIMDHF